MTCPYPFLILTAVAPSGPYFTGRTAPLRTRSTGFLHLLDGCSGRTKGVCAARATSGLRDLAERVGGGAAYRRIGSIAATLSLPVADGLERLPWRTLVELDRRARGEGGWVDTTWGVAWPYPPSELEAVVAS